MHKIPVSETISGAYNFAFAGFLSVLGIIWLPYLLLGVVLVGALYALAPDLPGHIMRGDLDLPIMMELARIWTVVFLFVLLVQAMVTVGLQQKALGRLPGPTFFYFSLGAPVWRLIGAYILAFLVMLLIYVLTAIAAAAISYAAVKFVPHFGYAIMALVIVAAIAWVVYAGVRLLFFLPSVVVAEDQIGLGRSWELGGGNFWRIVLVSIVVLLLPAMGFGMIQQAVTGPLVLPPDFAAHFGAHPHMSPNEIFPLYGKLFSAILKQQRAVLPFLIVLQIIQDIVFRGLGNGMIAKAYLGVTSPKAA